MTTSFATPPPVRRDPDLALVQASTAAAAAWIGELAGRLPLRHADSYRELAEAIRDVGERLNPCDDLLAGIDDDIRCHLGADAALGFTHSGEPPALTAGELTAVAAVAGLVLVMPERLTTLDLGAGRRLLRQVCGLIDQAVATGRREASGLAGA